MFGGKQALYQLCAFCDHFLENKDKSAFLSNQIFARGCICKDDKYGKYKRYLDTIILIYKNHVGSSTTFSVSYDHDAAVSFMRVIHSHNKRLGFCNNFIFLVYIEAVNKVLDACSE